MLSSGGAGAGGAGVVGGRAGVPNQCAYWVVDEADQMVEPAWRRDTGQIDAQMLGDGCGFRIGEGPNPSVLCSSPASESVRV